MQFQDLRGFDWDPNNAEHIARRGVDPSECESVLIDDPRRQDLVQTRRRELRVVSRGLTRQGRPLVVVWTVRRGMVRVVTAGRMSELEYAEYGGR